MADRPKLTLVEAAIEEAGEAPGIAPNATRAFLKRYAPSIAKLARAEERQALLVKVGAATIEEVSSLPHLRASFEREANHRARAHGGWMALAGAVGGAFVMILAYGAILIVSAGHDHQMVVTGAAISASNPTVIRQCNPGERDPVDGHTCGLPGQQ